MWVNVGMNTRKILVKQNDGEPKYYAVTQGCKDLFKYILTCSQ